MSKNLSRVARMQVDRNLSRNSVSWKCIFYFVLFIYPLILSFT